MVKGEWFKIQTKVHAEVYAELASKADKTDTSVSEVARRIINHAITGSENYPKTTEK